MSTIGSSMQTHMQVSCIYCSVEALHKKSRLQKKAGGCTKIYFARAGAAAALTSVWLNVTPFFIVSLGMLEMVATTICAIESPSESTKLNGPRFAISIVTRPVHVA